MAPKRRSRPAGVEESKVVVGPHLSVSISRQATARGAEQLLRTVGVMQKLPCDLERMSFNAIFRLPVPGRAP